MRWCAALLLVLCAGGEAWPASGASRSFEEVRDGFVRSEATLYDRHGERLHETRVDSRFRRLGWVALGELSPVFLEAVVAAEDRRFWRHGGVDWWSAAKAAVTYPFAARKRGASTITMQLASLLAEPGGAKQRRRRGVWEKLAQVQGARALEKSWTKARILEAYVNLVSYRGELQGIGAAAWGIFGKAPHGLDREEALLLAALLRAPAAEPKTVVARACALGRALAADFACAPLETVAARASLGRYSLTPVVALAPHVAARLLPSGHTRSTLDRGLQSFVIESLRRHVLAAAGRNVHDGAALVVDNETGEVLAYVGSVGDLSSARHVDGVQARRQAGSTLKPFLFATAIDRRFLTAASPLLDAAADIPVTGGIYRPRNYDNEFHGLVAARTALGSSLNVPAVRTLQLVGVDGFVRVLTDLGFEELRPADYYGPSLALGAADVSLWELVGAYRALARGGAWNAPRFAAEAPAAAPRRVFSPAAAFVVGDILSDRESRALTFGLENPLALRFWTAAKTGTSKDMRDNWCLGFSERYTVGVWTGNFSGESMWNVTGITGAAPVWAEIMNELHRVTPSRAPRPPAGLARSGREWYLEGTGPAPAVAVNSRQAVSARITYPVEAEIIARDPDIPAAEQRIYLRAAGLGRAAPLDWRINGVILTRAAAEAAWEPPGRGRFEAELTDRAGRTVDAVKFEIR